jgi:DNA-binding response OmpR family regulator
MNVLIADDDQVMIRLLSVAFRKAGFATFVVFDVVQASQTIRLKKIDAVVLDLAMPGGSGVDVIHRLKLSRRTVQIPIIVVSGSVSPNAREQLLSLGADDFFSKPPDVDALVASVRALVRASVSSEGPTEQVRSESLPEPTPNVSA